jgi:glycosyltransferase involved in cell wall biosynthesis
VSLLARHLDPAKFELQIALFEKTGRYLGDIPDTTPIHELRKRTRWDYPAASFKLAQIVKREAPDIVYSFMWQANTLSALLILLGRHRTKLILGVRTFPSLHFRHARFGKFHEFSVRRLYKRVDVVLTNSMAAAADMEQTYNVPRDRLGVLYNPVDIERVAALGVEAICEDWYPRDTPVVLAVGALSWQKDYPTLLRAFAKAKPHVVASLVILGAGSLKIELESLARELGLEIRNDVFLPGAHDNPYKFMRAASIFVLSSKVEGFPNVVIEAMACGTPVIATRCQSGPEEIITHENDGILVNVGDVDGLSVAMVRLLNDPDFAADLARSAFQRVQQFGKNVIVPECEALFSSLVDRKRN